MNSKGESMPETGRDEYFRRLVDMDALEAFLTDELGPANTYDVERHTAGHSNETLIVEWGDRTVVVRRPPETSAGGRPNPWARPVARRDPERRRYGRALDGHCDVRTAPSRRLTTIGSDTG